MVRRMVLCALLAAVVSAAVACAPITPESPPPPMEAEPFDDRETAVRLYELVDIGDTRAQIVEKLGWEGTEGESEGGPYTEWAEEGVGVAAAFWPDGRIRGKTLYYEDVRQLAPLTGAVDLSLAMILRENMPLLDAQYAIGADKPGIEIAKVEQDDSAGNPVVVRVMVWVNQDGSMLELQVSADDRVIEIKTYILSGEETQES